MEGAMEQYKLNYVMDIRRQESRFLYMLWKLGVEDNTKWWTINELSDKLSTLNVKSIQSKVGVWAKQRLIMRRYRRDSPLFEYFIGRKGALFVSRMPVSAIKSFERELEITGLDHITARVALKAKLMRG